MKFIDLASQQKRIKPAIDRIIAAVISHGQYIMGPEVFELEDRLKRFIDVKHAVSCASGTDALLMSLMAYGVGPGDAVFTTPFSFVATAEVICLLGATPVFVDIDPSTYNIDPVKLSMAVKATQEMDAAVYPLPRSGPQDVLNPKGIIAVDLFGLPADYHSIEAIAKEHDLFVIGDAAQSFGAGYKGQKSASLGDISCTSFFPAKPLGCYGDGGMCFTNSGALAKRLRSIRIHGQGSDKYENIRIGINGRLDTLQAAVLLAKMDLFAEEINLRQEVADRYTSLLTDKSVVTPFVPEGYQSVWAQYSILAESEQKRRMNMAALKEEGVPSVIYYPKPLHLQSAFKHLGYKRETFDVCEALANRIFSLPMHPYLAEVDQLKIVRAIS